MYIPQFMSYIQNLFNIHREPEPPDNNDHYTKHAADVVDSFDYDNMYPSEKEIGCSYSNPMAYPPILPEVEPDTELNTEPIQNEFLDERLPLSLPPQPPPPPPLQPSQSSQQHLLDEFDRKFSHLSSLSEIRDESGMAADSIYNLQYVLTDDDIEDIVAKRKKTKHLYAELMTSRMFLRRFQEPYKDDKIYEKYILKALKDIREPHMSRKSTIDSIQKHYSHNRSKESSFSVEKKVLPVVVSQAAVPAKSQDGFKGMASKGKELIQKFLPIPVAVAAPNAENPQTVSTSSKSRRKSDPNGEWSLTILLGHIHPSQEHWTFRFSGFRKNEALSLPPSQPEQNAVVSNPLSFKTPKKSNPVGRTLQGLFRK